MKMTVKLLGIAGKARSGKDTIGEYMRDEYDFKLYSFASPIKEAASKMFGIPLHVFYDGEHDREEVIPYWGFSPREILQKLGTECGRDVFRKDIWLKRGLHEWENFKNDYEIYMESKPSSPTYSGMIFTDVRFDNEADAIRERGGKIIHIIRDAAETVSEHTSEACIIMDSDDIVVYNNDSLEDLYINISDIMVNINEK
jgi:Deoxynucleotide monophosphate kinase